MEPSLPPQSQPAAPQPPARDNRPLIGHIIYGLYALTFVTGISSVIAVVVAYLQRDDVRGTWLESHNRWQIRTFWYGLLFQVIGWITVWILIGWAILLAATLWFAWRVAKGWIRLANDRPIEDPMGLV